MVHTEHTAEERLTNLQAWHHRWREGTLLELMEFMMDPFQEHLTNLWATKEASTDVTPFLRRWHETRNSSSMVSTEVHNGGLPQGNISSPERVLRANDRSRLPVSVEPCGWPESKMHAPIDPPPACMQAYPSSSGLPVISACPQAASAPVHVARPSPSVTGHDQRG